MYVYVYIYNYVIQDGNGIESMYILFVLGSAAELSLSVKVMKPIYYYLQLW